MRLAFAHFLLHLACSCVGAVAPSMDVAYPLATGGCFRRLFVAF